MKLIENLTAQTQDLKHDYLAQIAVWAKNDFERIQRLEAWYISKGAYNENKDKYYATQKFMHRVGFSILQGGVEAYINKERKAGERHYEDSLAKLVFRLNKKGVNDETPVEIRKAWVGINLEITIEHEGKVTRAFTIKAEGAIQRPHYRYLVK